MDIKFIERKDDLVEVEFDKKAIPNSLLEILIKRGIDAYCYEEHPMVSGRRLHIEAKNAEKELKYSINVLEKEWNEFGKLVKKEIKTPKSKR